MGWHREQAHLSPHSSTLATPQEGPVLVIEAPLLLEGFPPPTGSRVWW